MATVIATTSTQTFAEPRIPAVPATATPASAASAPASAASAVPPLVIKIDAKASVLEKIDQFVNALQDSKYTYALNAEMLNKILARNNASLLPTTIEDRAELANHGPVEAEAQFEWSEERARVYKVAHDIVTELFAQEAIEINDSLLSILHRYLFDDQARLPLTILMEQVMGYRFSPAQLQHLKKEASWQRHYTQGSIAGILLAAVGA
ncbi:MAG: hypothetical protein AB7N80_12125, partial [Bdellovibrionales bacterium]